MLTLQKGVRCAVMGSSTIPDWFFHGVQHKSLVASFSLDLGILMNGLIGIYRTILKTFGLQIKASSP